MEKNGFKRMKSDPNLYVHTEKRLYVLVYVDDLMFFGNKKHVEQCVSDLRKDLLLKVTGTLEEGSEGSFLGRRILRNAEGFQLCMDPKYVIKCLNFTT